MKAEGLVDFMNNSGQAPATRQPAIKAVMYKC